jgi:hypothetical protein
MPCKLVIKENIISVVEDKTKDALVSTLPEAQAIGERVNGEFGTSVVSFTESPSKEISRIIHIPGELVDIYYNHELGVPTQASEDTLKVMREAAQKMGINIQSLTDYAKGNPNIDEKGIRGVADLMKKTIGIAEGMDNVALTEEIIHIASAMMEQTHPKLITEMISKIDRYKIYKDVYKDYSGLKAYQLENGKPDIRKIKKEAVDKLIAEVLLNPNPDNAQYPELLEEAPKSMAKRWWDAILDAIRGMYRKSGIDVFQQAGEIIASGELDSNITPKNGGVFFNIISNPVVDNMYNTIKQHGSDMELIPALGEKKRHYLYKGVEVAKSVTEMLKEKAGKMFKRTDLEKSFDEMKREWGSEGHALIENFMPILIDQDGYKRDVPLPDNITSELPQEVQLKLKNFIKELVNSYPAGTKFLVEQKAVNTRVKGMLGSTIDLVIIEPITNKDGIPDAKVDVLDWKFTSISPQNKDDIPWFKKKEWIAQMGEYTRILYNYGLKPTQLRKARMIPFIMNYEYALPGLPSSGLYPKSIEIGKLNTLEETNLYLLPVPINSETTGNPAIDNLIKSLREQYEKLYKTPVEAEEKDEKDFRLNEINKAIRNLQLKLNFEPLINVATNFLESAARDLKEYEKIDYDNISEGELQKVLSDMLSFVNSAIKYQSLDTVYLSQYSKENLTPEEKAILTKLERISSSSKRMVNKINEIQTQAAISLGVKEGINLDTTESIEGTVRLQAEIPINSFDKTFAEAGRLNAKLIKLASQLMMVASKVVSRRFKDEMSEYTNLLVPLEKEARAKGKKAFDMIGTITPSGMRLIRKFDSKFWENIKQARKDGDKRVLLNNIDNEKFKELAEKSIKEQVAYLEKVHWSSDEEENAKIKDYRIEKAKDAIDIFRPTFDGFQGFKFGEILNKTFKEEGNLSREYQDMVRTDSALKVWEYFTKLNVDAKHMGYLSKQHSTSFFPLIEATTIQKLVNNEDFFGQLARSIKDLGVTDIDEKQNLAKIDSETGEVKKEIPKYFTRTNKQVSELSTDLTKVGALWIKSLLDYQKAQSLEAALLTLQAVEQSKGSIVVDSQNRIIYEDGVVKVREENPNAKILEVNINDFLYGIREDLSSIGNVGIAAGASKVQKDEEKKEELSVNVKKIIRNADIYTQYMAVGLNPLIGLANYVGTQLHAYINSGTFYKFGEFEKSNIRVTIGSGLSSLEKALMMTIIPNEGELMTLEQRKLAKAKGDMSWVNTWSFSDAMMITSSFPEHRLQLANALTFVQNAMIKDGKIVPIRQYLREQDRIKKYEKNEQGEFVMSNEDRAALEKSLDSRVEELKNSSSLLKTATFEDGKLTIPGVSDREIAKFSLLATEYYRNLSGQMNVDNKAGYRRDTMISSFMMFKHWIPKLVTQRGSDIYHNAQLNEWEYGRTRAFIKTWSHLGFRSIGRINSIVNGSKEGLAILDEMLEQKRTDYFRKTGQQLEITEEEYYDLMRNAIANEVKELKALVLLLGLVLAIAMAEPPEDASDLEKNRYKYWYKATHKISDELSFYYNPLSFESMTKGSIIPSAGIGARIAQFVFALGKETTGYTIDDQEMIDKSYPIKYFLNLFPGLKQFDNTVLPYVDPELAKELGIRVTTQSRMP